MPDEETLSEHLTSRAEVAHALTVEGGAGSTSFEMLRYVGDRFPLMPIPPWMDNPIDPISVRDVLHYLVAAADAGRVPRPRAAGRRPRTNRRRSTNRPRYVDHVDPEGASRVTRAGDDAEPSDEEVRPA